MIRRTTLGLVILAGCNNAGAPADTKPITSTTSTMTAPSAAPSMTASAMAAATDGGTTDDASVTPLKTATPTVTDTFTTAAGELTVTPIHHATLLLRVAGKAIYVDPVSADASYEGLPKADYVFVTDIHGDHMDPAGLAKVKKDDTVVVAPPAVNETMKANVVMKNGDTHDFGLFKVEAVPMYNLTRGPTPGKFFHDKGRGDGFVFTFGTPGAKTGAKGDAGAVDGGGGSTPASRVYVSGDTECTPEMKALKNIDVAFVCMNLPYTMPPSEAATCVSAFKPKVVFPFHYKGSNLEEFSSAIKPGSAIEVRKREWY